MDNKQIKSALISVYHKDGLDVIVKELDRLDVKIYSTGGTKEFIESLGVQVTSVEDITDYPSIFGGRVKTLHPKVFGGILYRREDASDCYQAQQFSIPDIDLVIVDLYPFEETVRSCASEADIIEKIDIGGTSLIRAAAKNFNDVLILSSRATYKGFIKLLQQKDGYTSIEDRRKAAVTAFNVTSCYDAAIFNYFSGNAFDNVAKEHLLKHDFSSVMPLRYGENPHQKAVFFGKFDSQFEKISGKEISYNNLLDIDAAVNLISEFEDITFAVIKHNNACGIASSDISVFDAWKKAFECDPISAFGGIFITNGTVDIETAVQVDTIFYEILIAPDFTDEAVELLSTKKSRILLKQLSAETSARQFRSLLSGVIVQDTDLSSEHEEHFKQVTDIAPTEAQIADLIFANKIVKHSKSNAIVLAKNKQLLSSGVGQTSRVDALKQAIEKAERYGFNLSDAVMASDAFFPFADCVELANEVNIKAIVQPGGSVRDNESIDCCNKNQIAMVLTGIRHFKH